MSEDKAKIRKEILDEFLYNVRIISDKSDQKRIWIEAKGPECQDFDDAVNIFFDDGDPILKKYKEYGITENQYQLLKKFRDEFEVFADNNDLPEEFIDTPEWERIMSLAKDVLKAFDFQKE